MKDERQMGNIAEPETADIAAGEQVTMLVDDVRALIRAELHYVRSRVDYSRYVASRVFRFGSIAAFAFSAAVIALVIGLVLTLAPMVGPGWATLLVTLGFIIIGAICGIKARNWARKFSFPEIAEDDDEKTEGTRSDRT